ncbi:MAG: glycoside hydrolase family 11 protein [Deltaproteobacteria bacterium]|nr:glycoside hydrolase family 11 protein [Deltaproteobacteria bacterium]
MLGLGGLPILGLPILGLPILVYLFLFTYSFTYSILTYSHFNAWASHGFSTGNLYEVSMLVEGHASSGSADVTVLFQ